VAIPTNLPPNPGAKLAPKKKPPRPAVKKSSGGAFKAGA